MDSRGLGELPRKTSLKPGVEAKLAGRWALPPESTLQSDFGLVNVTVSVVPVGEQMNGASIRDGCFMLHSEPMSTNAEGRMPRLLRPELTGRSSYRRPM
jgi:hypothetical protein